MAKRKTKSKEVSAHETAPTDPTPVAEALDRSPAVAAILASHDEEPQTATERVASRTRYKKTPDFIGGVATEVKVIDGPQVAPDQSAKPRSHVEFGSLPPYVKTILRSEEKGFRLLEDYANRKRLIQFLEKPEQPVIDELMAKGLRYDGGKQMWEISLVPPKPPEGELTRDQIVAHAAEIRDMTDRLALSLSGKAERLGYEVGGRSA